MNISLGLLLALLLHPVHETVAEVEWNSQSARLEVALRLSVLDQQWIGRQASNQSDVADWATQYLKRRFRIEPAAASSEEHKQASYHWVGREYRGSHVWWYFEIEPKNKKPPSTIVQRVLFERNDGYVNRVVVLGQNTRRALRLTKSNPSAKLNVAP